MKPITRDDTVHGVEYVTLAEANAAREADREAMRMALDALKTELSHGPLIKECHDAIEALKARGV